MRSSFVVLLLILLVAVPRSAAQTATDSTELVVLVHGMGRTSMSMVPLEISLKRAGYRVLNYHYSSYGPNVAQIGSALGNRIDEELREAPISRVHFVGHSLGNIVIRWLLVHRRPALATGRFVMLAPPNQGSRAADILSPYVGWLLAPIAELKTASSTVTSLPAPRGIEFMIIAGKWDNKVSVAETRLAGATRHLVVPSGHTMIMMNPRVIRLVRAFLSGQRGQPD